MAKYKNIILEVSLLFAATVGAGMFSLPYVFQQSGFVVGVFYLIVLAVIIISAHYFYFLVLEKTESKKEGLIGLVRTYFGVAGGKLAFLIVAGGLILTLVIHLILGVGFLGLLFPNKSWGVLVFWLIASLPVFFRLKSLKKTEFLATIFIIALIVYLAATTEFSFGDYNLLSVNQNNLFLPFGAAFFSLAGWTAIEPIFSKGKKQKKSEINPSVFSSGGESGKNDPGKTSVDPAVRRYIWKDGEIKFILASGTALAAIFYLVFIMIILNLKNVGPEALSGLSSPQLQVAAFLGLILIFTSYWPVGLEIKNGLEKDLKWPAFISDLTVMFSPLVLYFLGLKNFLPLVGLVGGVFLSLQYFLIMLVVKRVLTLNFWQKALANFSYGVFILGAVYEIFYFFK